MKQRLRVWYSRCFRVKPVVAKTQTGVAVTGFLFALVIGDLAISIAELLQPIFQQTLVPLSAEPMYDSDILSGERVKEVLRTRYISLLHLSVVTTLTVTSVIGYYTSVNLPKLRVRFFNKPFLQFLLDVMMVFVYFLLIQVAETPTSAADARPEVYLVFLSFVLYALWDLVSYMLTVDGDAQKALGRDYDPTAPRKYGRRRWVTVWFTAVAGVMAIGIGIYGNYLSTRGVAVVDSILIVILLVYRIAKSVVDDNIKTTDGV